MAMTTEEQVEYVRHHKATNGRTGFERPGDFLGEVRSVFHGRTPDPRLRIANLVTYGSEQLGADGGFAVGADFKEVWDPCFGNTSLLSYLKPLMTNRQSVIIPVDQAAEWTTTGLTAAQTAEAAAIAESIPAMKQVTVQIWKTAALFHASEELAEDVPAFRDYVWRRLSGKIAGVMENQLLNGNGVTGPLGLLNGPSTVTQAKSGATLSVGDVANMFGRLLPGGYKSSFWVAHPTVLSRIVGLGAGVYNPDGAGPAGTLMGRPLLVSDALPEWNTPGDLVLVDPRLYVYAVHAPRNAISLDFGFDRDLESYRAVVRCGGAPLLSAPVQPRTGTNTYGSAVILQTRS